MFNRSETIPSLQALTLNHGILSRNFLGCGELIATHPLDLISSPLLLLSKSLAYEGCHWIWGAYSSDFFNLAQERERSCKVLEEGANVFLSAPSWTQITVRAPGKQQMSSDSPKVGVNARRSSTSTEEALWNPVLLKMQLWRVQKKRKIYYTVL